MDTEPLHMNERPEATLLQFPPNQAVYTGGYETYLIALTTTMLTRLVSRWTPYHARDAEAQLPRRAPLLQT